MRCSLLYMAVAMLLITEMRPVISFSNTCRQFSPGGWFQFHLQTGICEEGIDACSNFKSSPPGMDRFNFLFNLASPAIQFLEQLFG